MNINYLPRVYANNCLRVWSALLLLLVGSWSAIAAAQAQLDPLWLTEGLKTPESVYVYEDGKEKFLFVSEIDGEGDAVDGKGGISTLSLDGEIITRDWVKGLNAPKGMAVYKGTLYVADIDELVVIDIKSRKITAKVKVADAVFLNDVTVGEKGVVYVSDTRTNKIHRIKDLKAEVYLKNISDANGLKALGSTLVIGSGPSLWLADRDKHLLKLASGFESGIDGVEMVKRGEFIVSCWAGLIYYVYSDGRIEKLLDSRAEKINTADLGYDYKKRIVYVPNFFKNSVTAYQLRLTGKPAGE